MRVNVIYTGKGRNDILDRQAQALADQSGWMYTKEPIATVDHNHFICYIELGERYSDWHFTSTSAWFTHFEANREWKSLWWELAAANCDLRIITSPLYQEGLAEYGLTSLTRPVIDPQFRYLQRPKNERKRVGVSGFVHPGGRKGEGMIRRLAGSKLARNLNLIATGSGWPIPTQQLDWGELPGWYNSLDVFICSSLVEGIPMPPLEALKSGVPVVIPRGVGMLDLLPQIPGIFRYDLGDYGQMTQALEEALSFDQDPQPLIDAVEPYNASNWASDHHKAFVQMKAQGPTKIESDRHGLWGVIYVAYGEPSRRCALAAIESFKEWMPDIPVGLIGTEPGLGEDVFIHCPDVDIGGRYAKTKIYELAPRDWQYVLYLDVDTQIVADVSFLFNVLIDGWDMVICKNPAKYHLAREMRRSDNADECAYTFDRLGTSELIQLNGGVFAFQRNARTQAFFESWHQEWNKFGKRDQGALLRALFIHPVRMYVLGNEWNTITRYQSKGESAGILHYPMTARRWRGKVAHRSDSRDAWAVVEQWERQNQ